MSRESLRELVVLTNISINGLTIFAEISKSQESERDN